MYLLWYHNVFGMPAPQIHVVMLCFAALARAVSIEVLMRKGAMPLSRKKCMVGAMQPSDGSCAPCSWQQRLSFVAQAAR